MRVAGMRATASAVVPDSGLRWGRAALISAAAWGTASAAHLAGGGPAPSAPSVVLLISVVAWPVSLLLQRRAGILRLVTLLGAAQAGMHVTFTLIAWSSMTPRTGIGAAAGHEMGGAHAMGRPAGIASAPGPSMHEMPLVPDLRMVLAHLTAALLLGLVLGIAERGLFVSLETLVERIGPWPAVRLGHIMPILTSSSTGNQTAPARVRVDVPPDGARLPQPEMARSLLRRGPPAAVVAHA